MNPVSEGVILGLATTAKAAVMMIFTMSIVPLLVWAERRGAALIQDRPGPNRVGPLGLLQPIADSVKLFLKEDVTPTYADKLLHLVAPLILFFPSLTAAAIVPFGSSIPLTIGGKAYDFPLVAADVNVGILVFLGVASLGVYGVVLAGWSSNNKYSLMGGIRSSAQIISYELAMSFAVLAVLLQAGSLRPSVVVEWQVANTWNVLPQFVGCIIFVVASFAETNRVPFDLAEADAELVGGFHTEYSSFRFGMFFMSEYMNMVAASAFITTLYFGGWSLPFVTFTGLWGGLASVVVFFAKVIFFLCLFIWVRWTLPRFRYDQLMALGWKILLPLSLANLLVTAAVVAATAAGK